MDSPQLIRRLHQHRIWVNQALLAAAEKLTPTQQKQAFSIGQGSVWKSLLHLAAAEFVWLAALEGDDSATAPGDAPGHLPGNQRGDLPLHSVAELKIFWSQLDDRWELLLQGLTPDSLDEVVYRVSTSSGKGQRFGNRRADALLHVCTHAQYTTAQVINMLRQLGLSPLPDVMLITLGRQETSSWQY